MKFPDETMIIVGHSMGGSIATKATAEIMKNEDTEETGLYKELTKKICGLIVIDVVEGSAIDALPFMESIVRGRPKTFKDQEAAVEYMYY
jgi:protein phosphatase methylesterase 1